MANREETKAMIEIMQAFVDGKEVQYKGMGNWEDSFDGLSWNWGNTEYRVKPPYPDVIPWDSIDPKWKYYARDEDGGAYLYNNEPLPYFDEDEFRGNHAFTKDNLIIRIDGIFKNLVVGTTPWYDSLQKRPE